MNQIIENKEAYEFDIEKVPHKIHNINLTEQQRQRLASGLKTDLIEGMIFEDGSAKNVKISLSENPKGLLQLDYDYQKDTLHIPNKVLGVVLSDDNKADLLDGKLISLNIKGVQHFIGVDDELNKITIKTENELGIPDKIGNYQLNEVDKYYLAAGKLTDQHLFQTKTGDYFLARVGLPKDKKGFELLDISGISKTKALEIEGEMNKSRVITDEKYMLPVATDKSGKSPLDASLEWEKPIFRISPDQLRRKAELEEKGIVFEDGMLVGKPEVVTNKETGKQYAVAKFEKENKSIEYLSVSGSKDGFTIYPKQLFLKDKYKGVNITDKMRMDFDNFKKVKLEGVSLNGKKQDVFISKQKDGGFRTDIIKPLAKMPFTPKTLSKER